MGRVDPNVLLLQVRDEPRGPEEERIAAGLRTFEKLRAQPQNDAPPTGKPVAVRIRCDDLDRAEEVAGEMKAYLGTIPGVEDISNNHDEGRIEYSFGHAEAFTGRVHEQRSHTLAAVEHGIAHRIVQAPRRFCRRRQCLVQLFRDAFRVMRYPAFKTGRQKDLRLRSRAV